MTKRFSIVLEFEVWSQGDHFRVHRLSECAAATARLLRVNDDLTIYGRYNCSITGFIFMLLGIVCD
jgi:hypothetical protein